MIKAVKAVAVLVLSVWSMVAAAENGSSADAASNVQSVEPQVSVFNAVSQPAATATPKTAQATPAKPAEMPKQPMAAKSEGNGKASGTPIWQWAIAFIALAAVAVLKIRQYFMRRKELISVGTEVLWKRSALARPLLLVSYALLAFIAYALDSILFCGIFSLAALVAVTTPLEEFSYDPKKGCYLVSCGASRVDGVFAFRNELPVSLRLVVDFLLFPICLVDTKVFKEVPVDAVTGTNSWMQRKVVQNGDYVGVRHNFWVNIHSKVGSWCFVSNKEGKLEALSHRIAQLSNLSE